MKAEEIKTIIENNKQKRDKLLEIKAELLELFKDENVKRYIELSEKYNQNIYFENKTDEQIFNEVIYTSSIDDKELYFCFGKNYIGRFNKMGNFYIVGGENTKFGIPVALYRNIYNMKDEVIIPIDKCEQFEREHKILYKRTLNPDSEYLDLKKEYFQKEMGKKYILKP